MDVLVVAGAGAATCRLPRPCSVVTQAVRGEHVHWRAVVTVETSADQCSGDSGVSGDQ